MTQNAKYLNYVQLLVCPLCKKKLINSVNSLVCTGNDCKLVFPVINGIPILINENNSIFRIKDYINKPSFESFGSRRGQIRNIVPSLSNNLSSKKNFSLINELLKNRSDIKILIVGGAEITSDTEMIFNSSYDIVESDVYITDRTNIIFDGHDIPFADKSFDLIIFQSVLEHVANPYLCVEEAHRVLKTDGMIYSSTPFMQQVHLRQYDFTRFTFLGHRRLFRHFEEIDSGVCAGTGVALGWSIRYFVKSLSNYKVIRTVLEIIVFFSFFWLKYIDYLLVRNIGVFDGASAFYFIGKKSNNIISDRELIDLYKGT